VNRSIVGTFSARRVRRDGRSHGGGLLDGPVHPGRVHHLRQLPVPEAGRVRLRLRAQERPELRAPPPVRLHLQLQRQEEEGIASPS